MARDGEYDSLGANLLTDFLDGVGHRFGDLLKLLISVHCGNCGAHEILTGRHGRGDGHDAEDAFFEKGFPEMINTFFRTEHDGYGGSFAAPSVDAEILENGVVFLGVAPEPFVVFRLGLHDIERGRGNGRLSGTESGTEDRLFRIGAQVIDDFIRSGDESARAGE